MIQLRCALWVSPPSITAFYLPALSCQSVCAALLRLLDAGRRGGKLTGPYRIFTGSLLYADVTPLAHALLQTAPGGVVWGSDWPHGMLKGVMPNDGDLADLLSTWIPDADQRHQVLVDNSACLYGF